MVCAQNEIDVNIILSINYDCTVLKNNQPIKKEKYKSIKGNLKFSAYEDMVTTSVSSTSFYSSKNQLGFYLAKPERASYFDTYLGVQDLPTKSSKVTPFKGGTMFNAITMDYSKNYPIKLNDVWALNCKFDQIINSLKY